MKQDHTSRSQRWLKRPFLAVATPAQCCEEASCRGAPPLCLGGPVCKAGALRMTRRREEAAAGMKGHERAQAAQDLEAVGGAPRAGCGEFCGQTH